MWTKLVLAPRYQTAIRDDDFFQKGVVRFWVAFGPQGFGWLVLLVSFFRLRFLVSHLLTLHGVLELIVSPPPPNPTPSHPTPTPTPKDRKLVMQCGLGGACMTSLLVAATPPPIHLHLHPTPTFMDSGGTFSMILLFLLHPSLVCPQLDLDIF